MMDPTSNTPSVLARLQRLEAYEQLRQLASRYALAVDTRDLDALVQLFVEDVRIGKHAYGRNALKTWYASKVLSTAFHVSIHQVTNHIIDFIDVDHATGIVYCRDELEIGNEWIVGVIQYWDNYERCGDQWYFSQRRLHRFYAVDALTRPAHGADATLTAKAPMKTPVLPDAWESWQRFWNTVGGFDVRRH